MLVYPLRFEPICQYRLWGGRRLENWLRSPPRGGEPIGEAWLLSDRDDNPSRVAEGPLKGSTIAELISRSPRQVLGRLAPRFHKFPLLLKFLDVQRMLSVQVHPRDSNAELIPKGETGKTEAWVVLESGPASRVYAGLKPGVTEADLRALSKRNADDYLASFMPLQGQSVLIEAGTVHSIGGGTVVFEVQQNSDVTFRLYDWDHIDPKTARPRPLQIEQALACVDFARGAILPVEPRMDGRIERLVDCSYFNMTRLTSAAPFDVGAMDVPRILVCVEGNGLLEYAGAEFGMRKGDVILLPAAVGICRFRPINSVTLLEIGIPEQQ